MGRKIIPSRTIYSCDRCGFDSEKATAGDGWWHHNSEHGLPPHTIVICPTCLPFFKDWLNL